MKNENDKLILLSKNVAKSARKEAEQHNKNATLIECISNNPDNYSFEEIVDVCDASKQYFDGRLKNEYFECFEKLLIEKLKCSIRIAFGGYNTETANKKTYEVIIYCKNHQLVFKPNDVSTVYVKTKEYMTGLPLSDFTEVLNRLNEEIEGLNLHIPFYDETLKNVILGNTIITEEQINPQILYPY